MGLTDPPAVSAFSAPKPEPSFTTGKKRIRHPCGTVLPARAVVAIVAIVAAGCAPLQQPPPPVEAPLPVPAPVKPGEEKTSKPAELPAAPGRIALLLPLSGPQRAVGEAVRDGFMAAYLADGDNPLRAQLSILDEATPTAYGLATRQGADMVVGPLLKEAVTQAAAAGGSVATLALNNLEAGVTAPGRFYQFALAPEDEAEQVAEQAVNEGQQRAIALVPDTDWGRRMLAAFQQRLQSLGGTVLAFRSYDPGATDYTDQIERLMLLDESRARHRQLSENLGIPLEFEPRRRDDVDFIFLAASAANGRLIRPQLRFLYAGDVPTYATSAVYQAGNSVDADLEGIMFMDAPVLIAPDARAEALLAAIRMHWPPDSASRLRFFAMGFDAYGLAQALAAGALGSMPGLSGMLSTDASGRVHRRMPWATFRAGVIELRSGAPASTPISNTAQP